ncbi:MAG: hypothetical protein OQK77_05250 [Psychromonas sp.]|nr:hypothetical protein [Psychromonas sp.]
MYDFIETIALKEQAEEDLYFEAVEDKLKHKIKTEQDKEKQKQTEVHVYIDDKHHKYYYKPH